MTPEEESKLREQCTRPGEPLFVLLPKRIFCPKHRETFRDKWPAGSTIFTVKAFQAVMSQEGFGAYVRAESTDLPDSQREAAEKLLDEKPLCCRLSPEMFVAIVLQCGIHRIAKCIGCEKRAAGVRILAKTPESLDAPVWLPHLCFTCIRGLEVRREG